MFSSYLHIHLKNAFLLTKTVLFYDVSLLELSVPQLMTYVFIGKSRSRSRLFLLSKIFLTWTYHKQKWLIQILGLKLSQNRSQDRFGTWYVHVKEIFDKRKKAWKKLALHRGSTGFRSQIWQQTHMHGAVSVEPNYIEVHKLRYCI